MENLLILELFFHLIYYSSTFAIMGKRFMENDKFIPINNLFLFVFDKFAQIYWSQANSIVWYDLLHISNHNNNKNQHWFINSCTLYGKISCFCQTNEFYRKLKYLFNIIVSVNAIFAIYRFLFVHFFQSAAKIWKNMNFFVKKYLKFRCIICLWAVCRMWACITKHELHFILWRWIDSITWIVN